jgi:hypothetical protein
MEIDLDINNYNFNDLIKLFNISNNLTESELKYAYRTVLKTHPDKSGLKKEYFLFFSKAFKLLKQVYDTCNKKESCVRKNIYTTNEKEDKIIKEILRENKDNFNEKFNILFEKIKLEDDEQDTGYGEWLKSNENVINVNATNVRNMGEEIDKIKKTYRDIIKYDGIQDLGFNNGNYNLVRERKEEYSSDIFSKLKYEDLKKAHTETFIPVTEEDYHNRRQFSNTNDLIMYRKQNETLLSEEDSEKIFRQKKIREKEEDLNNAYKLVKQMEKIKENNKVWLANFKLLKN